MWYEISSVKEVNGFMEKINFFHDSCIKELKYSSGAYVNDKYEMYPVNDRRILNVVFQCQREGNGMFEMEFQGLRYLLWMKCIHVKYLTLLCLYKMV